MMAITYYILHPSKNGVLYQYISITITKRFLETYLQDSFTMYLEV